MKICPHGLLDSELHVGHHGTVYALRNKNLCNIEHKGKKEHFLSLHS